MADELKNSFVNATLAAPIPQDCKQYMLSGIDMASSGMSAQTVMYNTLLTSGISADQADEKSSQLMETDLSEVKPMLRQLLAATVNNMNISTERKANLSMYLKQMIDSINTLSEMQTYINMMKQQTIIVANPEIPVPIFSDE